MRIFKPLLIAVFIMIGCSSANAQFTQSDKSAGMGYNAGWNELAFDLGYGNDCDEDVWGFAFNYATVYILPKPMA